MKELGEAINKSLSDIRTTLGIYTQITDPEVARMVNQVTNRILGLDGTLSRAQFSEISEEIRGANGSPDKMKLVGAERWPSG